MSDITDPIDSNVTFAFEVEVSSSFRIGEEELLSILYDFDGDIEEWAEARLLYEFPERSKSREFRISRKDEIEHRLAELRADGRQRPRHWDKSKTHLSFLKSAKISEKEFGRKSLGGYLDITQQIRRAGAAIAFIDATNPRESLNHLWLCMNGTAYAANTKSLVRVGETAGDVSSATLIPRSAVILAADGGVALQCGDEILVKHGGSAYAFPLVDGDKPIEFEKILDVGSYTLLSGYSFEEDGGGDYYVVSDGRRLCLISGEFNPIGEIPGGLDIYYRGDRTDPIHFIGGGIHRVYMPIRTEEEY